MLSESSKVAIISRLGSWLVRLLGATWRFDVTHDRAVRSARREQKPLVFSLWHGEMLPLLYHHRNQGIAVMISEHRDGEIIARIAEAMGFRTVRGSTFNGAARALIGACREIEEGHDVAITPDGPRGPAKSFAPGALAIAQRSGAPLVPVAVDARSAWRLKTWDGFMIPKPFAKVRIAYGEATPITADSTRQAGEQTDVGTGLMAEAVRRIHE